MVSLFIAGQEIKMRYTARLRRRGMFFGGMALFPLVAVSIAIACTPRIPTELNDFYLYGTQAFPNYPSNPGLDLLAEPEYCAACHSDFSGEQPATYVVPANRWPYTMMAQSWRDPIVHAAMQIAEKDASWSADLCMRCHAYSGFVQGRGNVAGQNLLPSKGENFERAERHGTQCIVCHRAVDPEYKPGISPSVDLDVFNKLGANTPPNFPANGLTPGGPLNGQGMVFDHRDRRRGPFDPITCLHGDTHESPFHLQSAMCASCHDVSNPVYVKQPNGSYLPNALDLQHPTGNKYEMYPMDRLYSEWSQSDFATTGVELTVLNPAGGTSLVGRYSFDGVTRDQLTNKVKVFNTRTTYTTCQSCHMPETQGSGCDSVFGIPPHPDAAIHNFTGVNSWVLRAVNDLHDSYETMMVEPALITESVDRNLSTLQRASDLELSKQGSNVNVRIINQCGHKLPSGYSEGRRVWVNVKFLDATDNVIAERGHFDTATGELNDADTKVYEALHGLDATMSTAVGLPPGPSFHIDINNKVYKDNRIPPRGFTNAKFEAIQSPVVGYAYADGQYWDDTQFAIVPGAVKARVTIYHQTTSKHYIEFLRDNATDPIQPGDFVQPPAGSTATTLGQLVYEQWVKWGKSEPALMDTAEIVLALGCQPADIADDEGNPLPTNGNNTGVNEGDYNSFFQGFFDAAAYCDIADDAGNAPPVPGESNTGVNEGDYNAFFQNFFNGCP